VEDEIPSREGEYFSPVVTSSSSSSGNLSSLNPNYNALSKNPNHTHITQFQK